MNWILKSYFFLCLKSTPRPKQRESCCDWSSLSSLPPGVGQSEWVTFMFLPLLPAFSPVPKAKQQLQNLKWTFHILQSSDTEFKSNKCPFSKVRSSSWLLPVFSINPPDNKKINSTSCFFRWNAAVRFQQAFHVDIFCWSELDIHWCERFYLFPHVTCFITEFKEVKNGLLVPLLAWKSSSLRMINAALQIQRLFNTAVKTRVVDLT